jgi:hypothetical protein
MICSSLNRFFFTSASPVLADSTSEPYYFRGARQDLRTIIAITQATLGAGAIVTWLAEHRGLAALAGVLAALCGILDLVMSPSERALAFGTPEGLRAS